MFTRYAIYYTPPPGPLAHFGAQWLGWDVATGAPVAQPHVVDLDLENLTEPPLRYGFHATIKPPFRLAHGCAETDLRAGLRALCATMEPVQIDALELVALGRFLALVPSGDVARLTRLAGAVVEDLDHFRAMQSDAELARRRKANLTPAQNKNLRKWGYPYVMDTFRFHMTLTGKASKADLAAAVIAVQSRLIPLLPTPFMIDSLTLVGERPDGKFIALERYALTG